MSKTLKIIFAVIGILLVAGLIISAGYIYSQGGLTSTTAQQFMMGRGLRMRAPGLPGGNYPMAFGVLGLVGLIVRPLFTLAVIAGVAWLIVTLVRRSRATNIPSTGAPALTAKEILQARYAKGEVTREEYQQMLVDLG